MGAVPTALLVGFGTPADLELDWVDGFTAGLREECGAVGAAVVGGDVVAHRRDHDRRSRRWATCRAATR